MRTVSLCGLSVTLCNHCPSPDVGFPPLSRSISYFFLSSTFSSIDPYHPLDVLSIILNMQTSRNLQLSNNVPSFPSSLVEM